MEVLAYGPTRNYCMETDKTNFYKWQMLQDLKQFNQWKCGHLCTSPRQHIMSCPIIISAEIAICIMHTMLDAKPYLLYIHVYIHKLIHYNNNNSNGVRIIVLTTIQCYERMTFGAEISKNCQAATCYHTPPWSVINGQLVCWVIKTQSSFPSVF